MARTGLLRVHAELLRLLRRLPARASDNKHVLEAVLVKRRSREADGLLALVVREMLGLAVAALHQDTGHTALRRLHLCVRLEIADI